MIKIENNYTATLSSLQPQILKTELPGKFGGPPQEVISIIPPLNTNISFTSVLPTRSVSSVSKNLFRAPKKLPDHWNWGHIELNDTPEHKKIKQQINKPGNQLNCGSCWAIATAGVIGDTFLISNITNYNPNLSTTYSLSCYPQGKCNGGNPAKLFEKAENKGLSSNHCIDYSWCLSNGYCSQKQLKPQLTMVEINRMIPACGCYYPKDHKLYKIKKPTTVNISKDKNIKEDIKKHIYTTGPVLGGFHVFDNFKKSHGKFTKSKGIYLEYLDYTGESDFKVIQPGTKDNEWKGSHAVAVIGWGKEKIRALDPKNSYKEAVIDVEYWICRNSWGTEWGDYGYFKIAMYPYNKKAQFEKEIVIESETGNKYQTGGFLIFEADKVVKGDFNKITPENELSENEKYYTKDLFGPIKNKGINIFVVISIIIFTLLIIIIYYYL